MRDSRAFSASSEDYEPPVSADQGAPKAAPPVHLGAADGFAFPFELPVRSDSGLREVPTLSTACV